MAGASGKKLDETYKLAWVRGLKTTYYLRTLAATSAEKSTGKGGELNAVSASGGAVASAQAPAAGSGRPQGPQAAKPRRATEADEPKLCLITDPTCEACQ